MGALSIGKYMFSNHAMDKLAEHYPDLTEGMARDLLTKSEPIDSGIVSALTRSRREGTYRSLSNESNSGIFVLAGSGYVITYLRLGLSAHRTMRAWADADVEKAGPQASDTLRSAFIKAYNIDRYIWIPRSSQSMRRKAKDALISAMAWGKDVIGDDVDFDGGTVMVSRNDGPQQVIIEIRRDDESPEFTAFIEGFNVGTVWVEDGVPTGFKGLLVKEWPNTFICKGVRCEAILGSGDMFVRKVE